MCHFDHFNLTWKLHPFYTRSNAESNTKKGLKRHLVSLKCIMSLFYFLTFKMEVRKSAVSFPQSFGVPWLLLYFILLHSVPFIVQFASDLISTSLCCVAAPKSHFSILENKNLLHLFTFYFFKKM